MAQTVLEARRNHLSTWTHYSAGPTGLAAS